MKAGSGRDARTGIDTQRVSPSDMVTHCAGCRLARGAGTRGGLAGGGGMGGDGTVGGVGGSFGGLGGGEHGTHRPHVRRQKLLTKSSVQNPLALKASHESPKEGSLGGLS